MLDGSEDTFESTSRIESAPCATPTSQGISHRSALHGTRPRGKTASTHQQHTNSNIIFVVVVVVVVVVVALVLVIVVVVVVLVVVVVAVVVSVGVVVLIES